MMMNFHRVGAKGDAGSALVAAIGVAVVGIALSTVVVSQAIVIVNDAARDRTRTIEIHAAEAGLDAAFKTMETETPCSGTITVGEGAKVVNVAVTYKYYDAVGELTCSAGVVAGTPTQAVIISSATQATPVGMGIPPQRQIEATVNLVPQSAPSMGAALFAGGGLGASNSGLIEPLDPEHAAQVWIEDQNWQCSNSYTIDGDVIVTDGSIQMSNSCRITGDAWALSGYSASNTAAVEGDLVVYNGDLGAWNSAYFGGDVSIGGDISDTWTWNNGSITVVGTVCSDNIGSACTSLPLFEKKGLPEVDYKPGDWPGFTVKGLAEFADDVVAGAGLSGKKETAYRNHPCHLDNQVKNPVVLPAGDTIYDLRDCQSVGGFQTSNGITFVLQSDVAFFSNRFTTSNKFLLKSSDTDEKHEAWFIVPDGGTPDNGIMECTPRGSYVPGNVQFSNQTDIQSPMELFVFTPCDAYISNSTAMIGQIYGDYIQTSNSFHLLYSGMGIPGVDLGGVTTSVAAGFSVEIVNKHEITN